MMESEHSKTQRPRRSGEVDSPSPSRRHHHSSHRNGSSHHSSQVMTTTHETSTRGGMGGAGAGEMAGLQVEHRVSSRRHHSHHHRHRHRSHHGEASAEEREEEEEAVQKIDQKDTATASLQEKSEGNNTAGALMAAPQQQQQPAYAASESSRASTRSSRLPVRRSERGSVVAPDISTYEDLSFQEVHPTGDATAERPSRKASQFSAAPSSSANFPSTSELSAMLKRDRATAAVAAAAKPQAVPGSATHSASVRDASYTSHDKTIDFQTDTQHKTAATVATPKVHDSHTASSTTFSESSPQKAVPLAAAEAAVDTKATAPPPPPSTSVASKRSSRTPQQQQPADAASQRSRTEKTADKATTVASAVAPAAARTVSDKPAASIHKPAAVSSSDRAPENVASLNSVHTPPPAGATPVSQVSSPAAAALAALKTTPQPDVLVRSWQVDVAPDAHNPPSSLTSSVCRGREREADSAAAAAMPRASATGSSRHRRHHSSHHRSQSSRKLEQSSEVNPSNHAASQHITEEDKNEEHVDPQEQEQQQQQEENQRVPATSSHRHSHASTPPASSLHRDSRSSSKYNAAAAAAAAAPSSSAVSEKPFAVDTPSNRPAPSTNGRSPQRTRTSSAGASRRRPTEFEPFKLNTDRRSTIRRTSSPQAYVPHDPLMEMPKEERERLMGLPHDAFNAPGTWRLDMRFEEDRKEYFRQTHLVDPMTRTRPGMRQFYIPEQADLFGMYPGITMTKDEEGNEIVEHLAPVPIQGQSFVKERKPYAPPRASPQRKSAIQEENQAYPAPPPPQQPSGPDGANSNNNNGAVNDRSASAGRPGRGLSGFVWGYGEEAEGRPGGLTPPRGRVVSDVTAPYRRNPAKSTGQIGHLGGDGTLNIFHMSTSTNNADDAPQFHPDGTPVADYRRLTPRRQQQLRDISQASTSFAIMQPTPSQSMPMTTTNSDYGLSPQRYADIAAAVAAAGVAPSSPPPPQVPSDDGERRRPAEHAQEDAREALMESHEEQQQQQQQRHEHHLPVEAVVLQPSVGGYSGSRSPSEGLFAPPRSVSPVKQMQPAVAEVPAEAPMTIQTSAVADDTSDVKSVDKRSSAAAEAKATEAAQPSPSPSQHRQHTEDAALRQTASERSSRRKAKEDDAAAKEKSKSDVHRRQPSAAEAAEEESRKSAAASDRHHRQEEKEEGEAPPQQPQRSSAAATERSHRSVAATPSAVPSIPASSVKERAVAADSNSKPQSSKATTPAPSVASASASARAPPPPPPALSSVQPPPAASTIASSSGVQTPTSAKPDSSYPVPSPAPLLPASSSSRKSKAHETHAEPLVDARGSKASTTTDRTHKEERRKDARKASEQEGSAAAAKSAPELRRSEKPSRASSSMDVPPPLPPPPSTQPPQRSTAAAASAAAPASATAPPPSSTTRTREASISMTGVVSAHESHYDPTATSEAEAPVAASTASSHCYAAAAVVAGGNAGDRQGTAPSSSSASSVAAASSSSRRSQLPSRKAPDAVAGTRDPQTPAASSVASSTRRSSVAVEARPAPEVATAKATESRASERHSVRSSSHHDDHRQREDVARDSVSSQTTSVASSSAPESRAPSEVHSSAFSAHQYAYASGLQTPASSVREGRPSQRCSASASDAGNGHDGMHERKPIVAESGTQTEFVFVLDPLQGRQFMQLEQEQQQRPQNVLRITDTRRSSSGVFADMSTPRQSQRQLQQQSDRSVSPSEQRAAGVTTGVSPTRMRRTGYANTSTNVRDLLRWN